MGSGAQLQIRLRHTIACHSRRGLDLLRHADMRSAENFFAQQEPTTEKSMLTLRGEGRTKCLSQSPTFGDACGEPHVPSLNPRSGNGDRPRAARHMLPDGAPSTAGAGSMSLIVEARVLLGQIAAARKRRLPADGSERVLGDPERLEAACRTHGRAGESVRRSRSWGRRFRSA